MTEEPHRSLLVPGENVWCVAQANRATMLHDAASYFGTLRQAMRNARRSIHIIGWDIDSRTPLVGDDGEPGDDMPPTLGPFLTALAQRKPELEIRLLLWDYSVLYTLERELLPAMKLRWNTPPQVELCLDDTVPFGASHHQKLVVIDDALAFVGGLDLTIRRWDTSRHRPRNPLRVDPQGKRYPPFHDGQLMLDGPAAVALAELAHARWAHAACETLPPVQPPESDPWLPHVVPDFCNVQLGIARTECAFAGRSEVREVERLHSDMIATAERWLYIECQFLTSPVVARALIERLREQPELEVVIVAPQTHHTWLEHQTMLSGRIRFMQAIRAAGFGHRVRLVHPFTHGRIREASVMVHAKLMIVDDSLFRIGSANLCNRSMGTDSECDVVIEARNAEDRGAIATIRNRLLGEHLGAAPEKVAETLAHTGSLFATLDALENKRRGLRPITDPASSSADAFAGIEAAADPERPLVATDYLADVGESAAPHHPMPLALRLTLLLLPIAALTLVWHFTPLSGLLKPEMLQDTLHATGRWGPVLAIALFPLLGALAFPLNVLIIVTALAFGIWPGLGYAAVGALISAVLTYAIGRWLGPGVLRNVLGPRINRISRSVRSQGIMAVTAVRLLPVAPFALVNLVAGATRIRFADYIIGTCLGMLPGLVLMSALGERLLHILRQPSLANILSLCGVLALCFAATWMLQRLVTHLRHEA